MDHSPYATPAPEPAIKPFVDNAALRIVLPVGRSGLAIAAGYLGLFALILIPAPLALAVGLMAIRDLRAHPEKHGMGRAVFAVIAGVAGTIGLAYTLLT